jgi:hypothetical protein
MERLEIVATLTAPLPGSVEIQEVLEKLHTARDKHIFRILATISSSDHSASARVRAFDELPKRNKFLGDATSAWVKMMARLCAMSNFLNVEIVNQCILLAQECFQGGHIPECAQFLTCVKTAVEIHPSLGGTKEGFGTLMELFGECRAGSSSKTKKLIALAECAPALFRKHGSSVGKGGEKAFKFAVETCLLGRGPSVDDPASEASDKEVSEDEEPVEPKTPISAKSKQRQSRKSSALKHITLDGTKSAVEDENLSLACRRVCAAVEFLLS